MLLLYCKWWRCCRISFVPFCSVLLFFSLNNFTALPWIIHLQDKIFHYKKKEKSVFPQFVKTKSPRDIEPAAYSKVFILFNLFVPQNAVQCAAAWSRVLPEEKRGNIWICSEGCNFRISPTPLIPSRYVVYFSTVLWSIARFLRSSQQVTGTEEMRPHNLKRING